MKNPFSTLVAIGLLGSMPALADTPMKEFELYLNAFHTMKDNPCHQIEAHHFCQQLNADLIQCTLMDGNDKTAKLTGIEYIISEKAFQGLPQAEKSFWHPHNFEILSGQLMAPNMTDEQEFELMKMAMNSYGKTWHTWNTGHFTGSHADPLPFGAPMLAWSFNHDGEALPGLVEQRDKRLGVSTPQKRKDRESLASLAHPQEGTEPRNCKRAVRHAR